MTSITIIVGPMCVGKTTYSKQLAETSDYEYINFDYLYHFELQKEAGVPNLSKEFISLLSKRCKPNHKYIIDNWFKWTVDWYNKPVDNTLELLKEVLGADTNIKLIFFDMEEEKVLDIYEQTGRFKLNGIPLEEAKRLFKVTREKLIQFYKEFEGEKQWDIQSWNLLKEN